MKQEFITSRGKIEVQRNTIYIKDLKFGFDESVAGQLLFPFAFLVATVLKFIEPDHPLDYFGGAMFAIMFLFYTDRIYDLLVKRSIAVRIPLNRIESFDLKQENSLETNVILYLKNGRYRSILFRTLEKQYEPFAETISLHIAQPQTA